MKDLTGNRFGRLVVLNKSQNGKWLCLCDCGNKKEILTHSLTSGKTQSCGCLQKERVSTTNSKHHARGTRLHNIWLGMRNRCNTPTHVRYYRYGGRGIKVCEQWGEFINFRDWALSHGYKDNLTLDRIDNNGNYEPSNCRWVTYKEQFKNSNVSKEFLKRINRGFTKKE